MRIGHGYDVHRLVPGRKLILGGVEIPWDRGLLGHSDADVLTHAVIDALLGAAALGDIGKLFPDTDPQYWWPCPPIWGQMPPAWRSTWRRPSAWSRAGSASRRRRKSVWASPAAGRALPPTRSASSSKR